jgi:hypothetical protein
MAFLKGNRKGDFGPYLVPYLIPKNSKQVVLEKQIDIHCFDSGCCYLRQFASLTKSMINITALT